MSSLNRKTKFLVQYRDSVTSRAGQFSLEANGFYEIYTYIYGEGPYLYFVNDRIYNIEPGSVLLLPPGVLVGGCKKKKARYTRLVCNIPVYMADFIGRLNPSLLSFMNNSEGGYIKLQGDLYDRYFSCVKELESLSLNKDENTDTLMFSVVLKMLLILKSACGKDAEQKPLPSDELIVKIIDVINREYANISSVFGLAEKLNYSKNYLSSYFKSRTDIGLHDFLVMKKLSVAATKLLSGKSVTEAAFECGFGSTAYFISAFKARYGVTPGKYLQDNR